MDYHTLEVTPYVQFIFPVIKNWQRGHYEEQLEDQKKMQMQNQYTISANGWISLVFKNKNPYFSYQDIPLLKKCLFVSRVFHYSLCLVYFA